MKLFEAFSLDHRTILWQITNQSVNVAVNYFNSNKSTQALPISNVIQSYLFAVGIFYSLSVSLNSSVPRLKSVSASTKLVLVCFVPFAAVASDSVLNIFLTRHEKMHAEINVYAVAVPVQGNRQSGYSGPNTESDALAPSLGKSRTVAVLATGETALSRVINSTPIIVVPPLVLLGIQWMDGLRRNRRFPLPINLGLLLGMSFAGLPLALSVFSQRQNISVERLKSEFHDKRGTNGMIMFSHGI